MLQRQTTVGNVCYAVGRVTPFYICFSAMHLYAENQRIPSGCLTHNLLSSKRFVSTRNLQCCFTYHFSCAKNNLIFLGKNCPKLIRFQPLFYKLMAIFWDLWENLCYFGKILKETNKSLILHIELFMFHSLIRHPYTTIKTSFNLANILMNFSVPQQGRGPVPMVSTR